MKKIIASIMMITILLCFSSCRSSKDITDSDFDMASGTTSEKASDDVVTEEATNTESSANSNVDSLTEQPSASDDVVAEEATNTESSANSNVNSSTEQPSASVKQPVSNTQPQVQVKTKPNFGKHAQSIEDLKKQVSFYSFDLPGVIVDYIVEEDLIYIVYRNQNLINLYDGNTGKVVYSHSLPGRPAEMHMYGNELWISFADLSCINVYCKADFKTLRNIKTRNNIFSFDVYNNYIFYASEEREQEIYRYDLTTQSDERILTNSDSLIGCFFEPAVLVDKNTATLYVAETNTTGCKLYSYNIETMEQRGIFESTPSSGYSPGFGNYVRKMLLLDGYVYWNNFKLDPNVFWKAEQSYGDEVGGDGILYADKDYVATRRGVYENNSGKLVLSFRLWYMGMEEKSKFAITKSKNIMYSDASKMYIFYG